MKYSESTGVNCQSLLYWKRWRFRCGWCECDLHESLLLSRFNIYKWSQQSDTAKTFTVYIVFYSKGRGVFRRLLYRCLSVTSIMGVECGRSGESRSWWQT